MPKHHSGQHESQCCHCSCLDKPWMRLLILFAAALVVFYIGIYTGHRVDRAGDSCCGSIKSTSSSYGCPMMQRW